MTFLTAGLPLLSRPEHIVSHRELHRAFYTLEIPIFVLLGASTMSIGKILDFRSARLHAAVISLPFASLPSRASPDSRIATTTTVKASTAR